MVGGKRIIPAAIFSKSLTGVSTLKFIFYTKFTTCVIGMLCLPVLITIARILKKKKIQSADWEWKRFCKARSSALWKVHLPVLACWQLHSHHGEHNAECFIVYRNKLKWATCSLKHHCAICCWWVSTWTNFHGQSLSETCCSDVGA